MEICLSFIMFVLRRYMTIYQDMFRKNDLELEIFTRKSTIFFHQKCFLDHTGILSEKKTKKNSFQNVVGTPWIYPRSIRISGAEKQRLKIWLKEIEINKNKVSLHKRYCMELAEEFHLF
jgi:hypothetical protein